MPEQNRPSGQKRVSLIRDFRHDQLGIAATELAFIIPIMLLLLIGMADAFNAYSAKRALGNVTATVGDLISRSLNDMQVNQVRGILQASDQLFVPFNAAGGLSVDVFSFERDPGTGAISSNWAASYSGGVVNTTSPGGGGACGGCSGIGCPPFRQALAPATV